MKASFCKLYRQLTPILFFLLSATALTGIIYGLSDRFFRLPEIVANALIAIHQGAFLGEKITPFYVLLMGLGVFALGLITLIESRDSLSSQQVQPIVLRAYRLLAIILVIPLAVCVETGVAYRLGTDWFGMSSQQTAVFLTIHGGSYLGTFLGIFYLLTVGSVLIALSIVGFRKTRTSILQRGQTQQGFHQQSETAYLSKDFLLDRVTRLRRKVQLAIVLFSIVFIGILYYATSKLLVSIAIVGIIFVMPALILAEKLIEGWQHEKEIQTRLYEREAESVTMLKAVPDSMLRMSQDGICLSYMPAKEAKSFILDGDIINKHVTEFLAPEIAQQFIKSAELSLQTGSTDLYRFPVSLDSEEQYYEARFTAIGQTEVLIMVREIANLNDAPIVREQLLETKDNESVQLLTEPELIQVLDTVLKDIQHNHHNHILFCFAVDRANTNDNGVFSIDDNLMHQILAKINSYLSSNAIFRLDDNELIMLVTDCTMEKASVLVDDLHHNLNKFFSAWQNNTYPIKFSIGLLEINADSSDPISLINAAKVTCEMARQKVNFKTFW